MLSSGLSRGPVLAKIRNTEQKFSVVFDKWGTEELAKMLAEDPDMYKLRRYGNDWLVKNEH